MSKNIEDFLKKYQNCESSKFWYLIEYNFFYKL